MKCLKCGAEIGLTDKVCPYCGAGNTEAAGHLVQMDSYRRRSNKTKEKVKENISQNLPILICAVVMILLLAGIAVSSYIKENAFLFPHWESRKDALKKYEEYSEEMRKYLSEGDYTGFAAYKELHVIPEYEEEYKEFEKIWDMASEYKKGINSIEQAVLYGSEARRSRMEDDISSCRYAIESFYREYDRALSDMENDRYYENLKDMKVKMDTAVRIYLGLDEEKLKEYLASSGIKQEAYLEEVLADE